MSVNAKDKKALQEMWEKAETGGGIDIPDGTYQFKIQAARFHMTEKGKPTFKTKVKIVGGDEDYVGKEFEINDNLETAQNQGYFKQKLRRLNITVPSDFSDITDGDVADEMEGKVFEGQVRTKNDFVNVYVNRLVSEGDSEEEKPTKEKDEEEEEQETPKSTEISEGDEVVWGDGKSGKVVEILEDDGKARVELEDETVVRVKLDLLSKAAKAKKEKDEEETEEEDGAIELPSAEEVSELKAPDVRKVLKSLDFDPSSLKDPRSVLEAFCILAEDDSAELELTQISALAVAFDITFKKDAKMKERMKVLAKAVAAKLN